MQRRDLIMRAAASAIGFFGLTARSHAMTTDYSQLPLERRAEAEAMFGRMMAALPYDRTTVAGADIAAEWPRLVGLGKGSPFIIGGDDDLERIAEQFSIEDPAVFDQPSKHSIPPPRAPRAILEAASKLRFPDDLSLWGGSVEPKDLVAPVGTWPTSVTAGRLSPQFAAAYDVLTGKPLSLVHILFLPTDKSWEGPAFLRWGDWNACPPAEYHVAALRQWNERFGAELIGITGDTIELFVANPPSDRETALAVAHDIYRYCPDAVDQGTESLTGLAASMLMQQSWIFWWD